MERWEPPAPPAERITLTGLAATQPVSALAIDPAAQRLYAAGGEGLMMRGVGPQAHVSWIARAPRLIAAAVDPLVGRVYATSWEAKSIFSFDAETGERITVTSGFLRPSGIVAGSGRVYVADTGANRVIVLDGWTCNVVESLPVDDAPYTLALDDRRARLYVGSPGAGTLSAFDVHSGKLLYRWVPPGLGVVQGIAADDRSGNVVVVYSLTPKQGAIAMLDGRDGVLLAETRGNEKRPLLGAYGVAVDSLSRRFYTTDLDGLLTFDADDGTLLGVTPGAEIAYPFGLVVHRASAQVYVTHGIETRVISTDPTMRRSHGRSE